MATTLTEAGMAIPTTASAATLTTAWRNGAFQIDRHTVVSRSNIVPGEPNSAATQSLPLGNGALGAAVWATAGFTAQLNRDDTFRTASPPGQVTIPGLATLTSAPDREDRAPFTNLPYAQVTGAEAAAAKHFGPV